jgi:hypothetical protein
MVIKKSTEDKINIKNFRDSSSNWWVRDAHYFLNEENELLWAAGESDKTELRDAIESFIKRNRKVYVPRSESIFDQEEKEYSKIGFGKYSQMSTIELVGTDRAYSKWLYENTADKKLKEELQILLKK